MVDIVSPSFLVHNFLDKFGPEFLNHFEGITEDLACRESMFPERKPEGSKMDDIVSPSFLVNNFLDKFGPEFLNHLEGITEDLACRESMFPAEKKPEGTVSGKTSPRSECQVRNDSNSFQVKLDVTQYKPEEISLKTVGDSLIVHGQHEARRDDGEQQGYVSREFTRRFVIPEGVEPESMKSSLSEDGYLTIDAPKKRPEVPKSNERVVPIKMMDEEPKLSKEEPVE